MATVNKAFRVKNGLIVEGAALEPAKGTTTYPPILFSNLATDNLLSTPTAGAMEYDGTNFYLTAGTGGRKTIAFTDLVPSLATSTTLGTIKLASDTAQTVAFNAVSATASRSYGLQVNASGQGVINVPWTDTVYTLPTATASALGGIELFSGTTQSVAANAVSSTASRTYGLQLNSDLQGVVNVPWTDTVYTLPAATDTVRGGIELFNATAQSVAANSVTTTASRTYGLQVNADGQGVINVPWSDTNTFPTTWTYTDGTTAGPTASITGTSSTISVGAIPSASGTVSGIVTTGAQTFAGVKTMTSPAITTSLTTGSTSFDLVNTTATTVNFAGAGTAVSIGSATGNTTVNNSLVVTGNLTVNGTTTTVNSTTVTVDDIVLELGAVASPSNTTANGGGILVKAGSDVDKTLTWSSTGANWTSSENLSLATGKTYKINNVDVLSATGLGSTVVSSSLTSVGTITSGTWSGSFGAVSGANLTTLNASNISSGTIGAARLPSVNIGTTSVDLTRSSGALTLAGLTLTTPVLGVATATSINKVAITAPATSATLTIADGKTLTASNTLTFTGTDGSTLNVGTGGTLGTGAFATIADYAPKASPALTGTPTIDAYAGLIAKSGTTTGTTAITLGSIYPVATYNGGEFTIKATNGSNVEITKVLVITDGTNVYMTTYGDVFISSDLVTVDFTYTTAPVHVNMVITPVANTSGTTTVKVTGTLLAV
jgi:hypothetical protein